MYIYVYLYVKSLYIANEIFYYLFKYYEKKIFI